METTHHPHGAGPSRRLRDKQSGALRICRARWRTLAAAAVLWAAAAAAPAQTLIGSAGAGFQTWTTVDLNNNNAPFWDGATVSVFTGNPDSKNVGFCLTSNGDCVGIASHVHAPGPLPYWGMPYDASADSGGAIDPNVYFHRSHAGQMLHATLQIQLSTVPNEINEIGWFETDATGSIAGTRHVLFRGGALPPAPSNPDPVGKMASFKPTAYFGYYFADVSENSCLAYSLAGFTENGNGCAAHSVVVFSGNHAAAHPTYWIAGIDPPGCNDGDCNLTLIKVGSELK